MKASSPHWRPLCAPQSTRESNQSHRSLNPVPSSPSLTHSFVYPRMTAAAFDARMRTFMDTDWRTEAARILDLRLKGEESQRTPFVEVFEL